MNGQPGGSDSKPSVWRSPAMVVVVVVLVGIASSQQVAEYVLPSMG